MKCNTFKMGHMEKKENKKNILDIKWNEKAIKNFEGFLKQMYGEHGNLKMPNFQYGKIKVD